MKPGRRSVRKAFRWGVVMGPIGLALLFATGQDVTPPAFSAEFIGEVIGGMIGAGGMFAFVAWVHNGFRH